MRVGVGARAEVTVWLMISDRGFQWCQSAHIYTQLRIHFLDDSLETFGDEMMGGKERDIMTACGMR